MSQSFRFLVDEQRACLLRIQRADVQLTVVGEITENKVRVALEFLERSWQHFTDYHAALQAFLNTEDETEYERLRQNEYFSTGMYDMGEKAFIVAKAALQDRLSAFEEVRTTQGLLASTRTEPVTQVVRNNRPQPPPIQLPKFDGNLVNWANFKGSFESIVIENTDLSLTQKLQYLQQSLTGTAAQRICHMPLVPENFYRAWNSLVLFYDNRRVLVSSQVRALLDLPTIQCQSAKEVEQFHASMGQHIEALRALERPIDECGDIIVEVLARKLDRTTLTEWEKHLGPSTVPPTLEKFEKFLLDWVRTLNAMEGIGSLSNGNKNKLKTNAPPAKVFHMETTQSKYTLLCEICKENHYLAKCKKFRDKSVPERREMVKRHKLCFNCLKNHQVKECTSKFLCQECKQKHHTRLHIAKRKHADESINLASQAKSSANEIVSTNMAQSKIQSRALLPTAIIKVENILGDQIEVRALLDQGSEVTLITETLAKQLRLPRKAAQSPIVGIGAGAPKKVLGHMVISAHSLISNFSFSVSAAILPRLTGCLPSSTIDTSSWHEFHKLPLADPSFFSPGKIDMLLGADIYGQLLVTGLIQGTTNTPTAQNTALGWVISGNTNSLHDSTTQASNLARTVPFRSFLCTKEKELYDLMTHARNKEGRYIVRLPTKTNDLVLGDSRSTAVRIFKAQEKEISKNPEKRRDYVEFMRHYQEQNFMVPVDPPAGAEKVFYMPHHGVYKDASTTTKLRVVFNASKATKFSPSLNSQLYEGPKLLADLASIITRWRIFRYAFTADVSQMYPQILLHTDDQDLQRIVWRERTEDEIQDYKMTRVTFGIKSAPFLALSAVKQLELDEGKNFPLAKNVISNNCYMDDLLCGANSIEIGLEKIKQIRQLFKAGGFHLRKWVATHPELIKDIPEQDRELAIQWTTEGDSVYKALGLNWNPITDDFSYSFKPKETDQQPTKRKVLSSVAQLFDPLGWASPVIVQGKIILQKAWESGKNWDEKFDEELKQKWLDYWSQLKEIDQVKVPRWLNLSGQNHRIELHGFGDASTVALGAAVHMRITQDNEVVTRLIAAKSKVAPIKRSPESETKAKGIRITIPRLELSAALLVVKLVEKVIVMLQLQETEIHFWTDSRIVYHWINGDHSRWKQFVQNRVKLIKEKFPKAQWHHLPGSDNPADIASRGTSPRMLKNNELWWSGPSWLQKETSEWPDIYSELDPQVDLEEKPSVVSLVREGRNEQWNLVEKFSSIEKLLRVTAWCQRFVEKKKGRTNYITAAEREKSRLFWIRDTQRIYFSKELTRINQDKELPQSSKIKQLNVFVDENGIIRVGGRLNNASLHQNQIHPMILPEKSPLTILILRKTHEQTLHGTVQGMLAAVRREFWIVGGRAPIRSYIWKCPTCTRHRGKTLKQLMGQLPAARVNPARPFLHTGVDYAGPFNLKTWKGRGNKSYKAYLIVFVCFTSSAVHLELATDYSTHGFLAAFQRFTSRRGICSDLYSDCGTNLVGADHQLQNMFQESTKSFQYLAGQLTTQGVNWHFNPPGAPHFGGKWEAAVKSTKWHIKRIIGENKLTYEEFSTLLIQIEAVLNSRPLCPVADDPEDLEALTPGHFLIGSPLQVIPEPSCLKISNNRLSDWQLIRKLLEQFWKRWQNEYLHQLQQRSKWINKNNDVQKGALVLLKDENLPPARWALARVVESYPGQDGLTRVVKIRTQNSELTRPIHKLCLMPMDPAAQTKIDDRMSSRRENVSAKTSS